MEIDSGETNPIAVSDPANVTSSINVCGGLRLHSIAGVEVFGLNAGGRIIDISKCEPIYVNKLVWPTTCKSQIHGVNPSHYTHIRRNCCPALPPSCILNRKTRNWRCSWAVERHLYQPAH